jgi:pimeloyl-ACP methyl ester carboxylesterase
VKQVKVQVRGQQTLLKMRIAFILRGLLANVFPTTFFARKFLKYISRRGTQFPEQSIQAFITQVQSYKLNTTKIPIISDYDLAHLPLRTLLLLGKDKVLYDAEKVISRVRAVASFVTIAILAEAKHMVSVDQPDLVNEKIIQFPVLIKITPSKRKHFELQVAKLSDQKKYQDQVVLPEPN